MAQLLPQSWRLVTQTFGCDGLTSSSALVILNFLKAYGPLCDSNHSLMPLFWAFQFWGWLWIWNYFRLFMNHFLVRAPSTGNQLKTIKIAILFRFYLLLFFSLPNFIFNLDLSSEPIALIRNSRWNFIHKQNGLHFLRLAVVRLPTPILGSLGSRRWRLILIGLIVIGVLTHTNHFTPGLKMTDNEARPFVKMRFSHLLLTQCGL